MARILISAGEASGDLYAGAVTRGIKQLNPEAEVFGMGGDCLREAGGEVLFDIKDHSLMGFVEVLKKLPDVWKLRNAFIDLMEKRKPDVLLTIDYPGFNMRLAKLAKERGINVVYFIAPQVWAWRPGRAADVAKVTDKIACIFPFECDFYKSYGADIEFIGHPLVDTVKPSLSRKEAEELAGKRTGHPLILLMPGSREMEIQRLLPVMLDAVKILKQKRPELDFAIPRAATIAKEILEDSVRQAGLNIRLIEGHNYDVMSVADLAIVTSGTVTLEAAMCGLGCEILYKSSPVSFWIAKRVVKIPNIGLPNIVAGRQIEPELLQDDCTPENISSTALELLEPERFAQLQRDLQEVKEKLGEPGAVKRVAELVLRMASLNQKDRLLSGKNCQ
ncbi:MAG: lipid-A-disaccharide synthase [Acidaminococcaceae bacterium]|jgi:lipid-A-disaccharide synthase|nr:lipid-A-disaccharide synthase [Acidaminococcaceae bacterium]